MDVQEFAFGPGGQLFVTGYPVGRQSTWRNLTQGGRKLCLVHDQSLSAVDGYVHENSEGWFPLLTRKTAKPPAGGPTEARTLGRWTAIAPALPNISSDSDKIPGNWSLSRNASGNYGPRHRTRSAHLRFRVGGCRETIITDTTGYAGLVFGLFAICGYRFSPRIADLAEHQVGGVGG
ncbi:Tn3 family transposase [Streptosporangium sp. NPDC002544]|uniref:Tn3 family transposase n=1 Tax=Streptosporangium sp. NPDC002544 TaxID=3154538 RepID=UPI00331FC2BD